MDFGLNTQTVLLNYGTKLKRVEDDDILNFLRDNSLVVFHVVSIASVIGQLKKKKMGMVMLAENNEALFTQAEFI